MDLQVSNFRRPAAISHFMLFAVLLSVLGLCCGLSRSAMAQSATAGAIGGTITDSNGALLPTTTVTVKSVDTGSTRSVKSNASGEYRVSDLQPGNYTATFVADGFSTYEETSIAHRNRGRTRQRIAEAQGRRHVGED